MDRSSYELHKQKEDGLRRETITHLYPASEGYYWYKSINGRWSVLYVKNGSSGLYATPLATKMIVEEAPGTWGHKIFPPKD